jgi:hypothetical protein
LACRRKSAAPDLIDIGADRRLDGLPDLGIGLGVSRRRAVKQTKQIVPDLHLPVTACARADPDRRNAKPPRHLGRQRRRHQFEHNREGARRLQQQRILKQAASVGRLLRLHTNAELMLRLRRETEMPMTGTPSSQR